MSSTQNAYFITLDEAKERFGSLETTNYGVITLLEFEDDDGVWVPVFNGCFQPIGYKLDTNSGGPSYPLNCVR